MAVKAMNASAIFNYEAQPKERVEKCNLCGGSEFANLATQDRYGFPVRTDGCLSCGLVFLNPRMTRHAYARFYEGPYRALVSAFHGREINAKTIQAEQREYAGSLAAFLWPHIGQAETLLDVGGSTGTVARYLAQEFGMRATVLDPSSSELIEAADLEAIYGFVEDWEPNGRTWDLITLCQTVDHLLDISGTLKKLSGCLSRNGKLFVDIVDYDVTKASKVDHPFNLTRRTMAGLLGNAGFYPVGIDDAGDGLHVRFLA